ncbi:glycosyltransferase family 87 protein [Mucilaginibacter sp.]|uniref:glycosyltransferase family 87 protein n=1 Tax=Mucilaginibacter sp. TaxID=1882438 RepID=UPI003266A06F
MHFNLTSAALIESIKKLFTNRKFVLILWFGLSFIAALKQVLFHAINNYKIYKYTFYDLINQKNLFLQYPQFFEDKNHYGPVFALVIMPFYFLPDGFGVMLWSVFNSYMLYKAVTLLPITDKKQVAIFLICAHELMTTSFSVQVNPLATSLIILSFIFIRNKQDFWAACMIALGTYIKLYGIVGLAFFFFSENKIKFTLSMVFWTVVFFVLPMPFSSPHFTVQCYKDWYKSLSEKDIENSGSTMQDISVKGMARRIFNVPGLSKIWFLVPGVLLYLSSYIRINAYKNVNFQLLILASTLIFPIIFSSSSESPTYIIAFLGVAIWFINLDRPITNFEWFLLIFAVVITSFSPSDLFPKYISTHITKKYALKALPCLMIWLKIIYETWTRPFSTNETEPKLQPTLTT